jgi:hypothetical protein
MAGAKLRTQGLGAWEAYTSGAFRRYADDGLGWARPWLGARGGGLSGSLAAIHNHVQVHATGDTAARVQAIVSRELGKFAAAVESELFRGAAESASGLMC